MPMKPFVKPQSSGPSYTRALNNKSPVPTGTKIQVYTMYVRSVLTYASSAWAHLISKTTWSSIETVRNIALHAILSVPFYVSTTALLKYTVRLPYQSKILPETTPNQYSPETVYPTTNA